MKPPIHYLCIDYINHCLCFSPQLIHTWRSRHTGWPHSNTSQRTVVTTTECPSFTSSSCVAVPVGGASSHRAPHTRRPASTRHRSAPTHRSRQKDRRWRACNRTSPTHQHIYCTAVPAYYYQAQSPPILLIAILLLPSHWCG